MRPLRWASVPARMISLMRSASCWSVAAGGVAGTAAIWARRRVAKGVELVLAVRATVGLKQPCCSVGMANDLAWHQRVLNVTLTS
jgi:hypothetical protein